MASCAHAERSLGARRRGLDGDGTSAIAELLEETLAA
jgi:hypothetical protein